MHTDNILYLMEYLARSFFRHCWDVTRVVVSTKRLMILLLLILWKLYPIRTICWYTIDYIFLIHLKRIYLVTFYCMISENGILSCGRPILKYVLPFDPCKHIQVFSQIKTFSFNWLWFWIVVTKKFNVTSHLRR